MSDFMTDIKQMRSGLGWSQEDLAREVGVSLSTIQRVRTGRRYLDPGLTHHDYL